MGMTTVKVKNVKGWTSLEQLVRDLNVPPYSLGAELLEDRSGFEFDDTDMTPEERVEAVKCVVRHGFVEIDT